MPSKKKCILLIMPRFYNYSNIIVNALQRKGYEVNLIYEEPPRILFLIAKKIQQLFHTKCLDRYFNKWICGNLKKKKQKYDYFLVIRGNIISKELIKFVKESFLKENARTVYYTWDSLEFLQHKGLLAEEFDEKFSFDLDDVKNYSGWQLLPLFYTDDYKQKSEKYRTREFDLVCICSLNKYRYNMVKDLQEHNPTLCIFNKFYIGKILFYIKRLMDPFFRKIDVKDIIFKPLKPDEVIDVYLRSKAVLDVTYQKQSGLSLRTIEAIGMKKKIVTNNKSICYYDFFSNENVYIYDENMMTIPDWWLQKEFAIEDDVHEKYALENWLTVLLKDI